MTSTLTDSHSHSFSSLSLSTIHSSMTTEPQKHDQIDKRVPTEIWERIFDRLYPSQLTRLSRVNKNFNRIVSSLSVWLHMFSVAFGPTVRLRTLCNMPESKSYMLYMCASSLYVCEECFSRTSVQALYEGTGGYRQNDKLPKKSLAPMPTLSNNNLTYLGEEVNEDWTIWMCPSCRGKVRTRLEVGDDAKTVERIRWYRKQK